MHIYINSISIQLNNGEKLKFTYKEEDEIILSEIMYFDDSQNYIVIKDSDTHNTLFNKDKIITIDVFFY